MSRKPCTGRWWFSAKISGPLGSRIQHNLDPV
jgi:hypothetical protein